ncbi:MAG: hypothetical protein K8I02_08215, partial [Candidatus Methylomirabilis sp.]|nr:hypothetical protein [Deltaproteobacteria bacterium]
DTVALSVAAAEAGVDGLGLQPQSYLLNAKPSEIVARFDPWDPEKKKSADLQDIAFNSRGQLFVSTSQQGRVWRINSPSPAAIFDGTSSTTNKPYVDLRTALKADAKARLPCGNIAFDPQDNLYLCAAGYGGKTIGSIYRIPEVG